MVGNGHHSQIKHSVVNMSVTANKGFAFTSLRSSIFSIINLRSGTFLEVMQCLTVESFSILPQNRQIYSISILCASRDSLNHQRPPSFLTLQYVRKESSEHC